MTDTSSRSPQKSTPCMGCGGSGQTSFFGGASRFMFTWEDCPDCHGTGINLEENPVDQPSKSAPVIPQKDKD